VCDLSAYVCSEDKAAWAAWLPDIFQQAALAVQAPIERGIERWPAQMPKRGL
jgi:hypothetical protein